ncbi:MAG: ribonuclease PH [Chloroflexia bacterium]
MSRTDGRRPDELRSVRILPGYAEFAEGSALIEIGRTRVLCTASVEEQVPPWLRASNPGSGWVTAEYAMLPRSTPERMRRERGTVLGGRTQEIQRLIGRALRAAVDLSLLGERTVLLDCDVIQADGGTRTAAITGAYVALHLALQRLLRDGRIERWPVRSAIAAVSVGVVNGEMLLDLTYTEDAAAEVDLNVVMTQRGRLVEIQGTAEREPFSLSRLEEMVRLARVGLAQLFRAQQIALEGHPAEGSPVAR